MSPTKEEIEAFLRRKYVQRRGGTQNDIDYMEAATDDLAKELFRWLRWRETR